MMYRLLCAYSVVILISIIFNVTCPRPLITRKMIKTIGLSLAPIGVSSVATAPHQHAVAEDTFTSISLCKPSSRSLGNQITPEERTKNCALR